MEPIEKSRFTCDRCIERVPQKKPDRFTGIKRYGDATLIEITLLKGIKKCTLKEGAFLLGMFKQVVSTITLAESL